MPFSPFVSALKKASSSLSKVMVLGALALVISACQSTPSPPPREDDRAIGLRETPREPEWLTDTLSKSQPTYSTIWERMREGFQLQDEQPFNPRIEQQRLWFASRARYIGEVSERSAPYIHYIVERLAERNMPMEFALLPVIESAYNPHAYSPANAAGLWQFMPGTGRVFNLQQTNWYDGRRDVTASTRAALEYLSRLHEMFNGDWLLALAAYNAGEGRISRAVERNEALGLPTDYWNLTLPKETQDYVPRLLALAQIIATPEAYGVELADIADEPYFEKIAVNQRLDLARVARLADLDEEQLRILNPAYKQGVVMDGPQHLLVPTDKAQALSASLSLMPAQAAVQWQQYTVKSGDSLSSIANRYHMSVATLQEINRLKSPALRIGQTLNIPSSADGTPREPLYQRSAKRAQPATGRVHIVKNGDNLWQIARHYQVAVHDLKRINRLSDNSLRIGQTLRLEEGATGIPAERSATQRGKATYYRVQRGDSLSVIAKRFNVALKQLRSWNRLNGSALKPGQTLTLYLP